MAKAPENIDYGRTILTWRAPEYRDVERGPRWMITAGVFALMLISWSIWQQAYPFAIVVILLAGIYFLTHSHKPKEVSISLTTGGILADKRFFPYTSMKVFWILYEPESNLKTLNVQMRSGMVREMSFQLEQQDPAEVRSFLGTHVFELEDREETIVEKTIRILKL